MADRWRIHVPHENETPLALPVDNRVGPGADHLNLLVPRWWNSAGQIQHLHNVSGPPLFNGVIPADPQLSVCADVPASSRAHGTTRIALMLSKLSYSTGSASRDFDSVPRRYVEVIRR